MEDTPSRHQGFMQHLRVEEESPYRQFATPEVQQSIYSKRASFLMDSKEKETKRLSEQRSLAQLGRMNIFGQQNDRFSFDSPIRASKFKLWYIIINCRSLDKQTQWKLGIFFSVFVAVLLNLRISEFHSSDASLILVHLPAEESLLIKLIKFSVIETILSIGAHSFLTIIMAHCIHISVHFPQMWDDK